MARRELRSQLQHARKNLTPPSTLGPLARNSVLFHRGYPWLLPEQARCIEVGEQLLAVSASFASDLAFK